MAIYLKNNLTGDFLAVSESESVSVMAESMALGQAGPAWSTLVTQQVLQFLLNSQPTN